LQFTADRVSAVNCAAVEVWKLITDADLPLEIVASYDGFGRHDGRGWLEFHDGVSNMHSSQRPAAVEVRREPEWMAGGTYMAFLRVAVDLAAWRRLTRSEQELVVGRDRLSGAGLIATKRDASGRIVPVAASALDPDADDRSRSELIDPPQTVDPIIEASHVHRANQVRGSPLAAAALRIFRQGYEFLEDIDGAPRAGLNFVSFQRDLDVINHLLHLPGWLGDVNFGGRTAPTAGEPRPPEILTVEAGGYYAVPPTAVPFPGATLLCS
jgi:Dyp-type peroxidase family